jgi:hypothetical protein
MNFELLPRDLSAYKAGNTGIPYAFRFDSGKPGPAVGINALTHGNEFCGMVAACALLDAGVRPERGSLTISFANVAAYESFTTEAPFESRQLVHNLNRIWSAAELDGTERSPELDRAREMRSLFDPLHALLDIHSTSQDAPPFFVCARTQANIALAEGIGFPGIQLLNPTAFPNGTPLKEYGPFGAAGRADRAGEKMPAPITAPWSPGQGGAVVVECGQHFFASAGVLATQVSLAFLAYTGVLSKEAASALSIQLTGTDALNQSRTPVRKFELLYTHVIRTAEFRFVKPLMGMETFDEGELIGTDGDQEIRALCKNCTVFMPLAASRTPVPGREGVYLTKPV